MATMYFNKFAVAAFAGLTVARVQAKMVRGTGFLEVRPSQKVWGKTLNAEVKTRQVSETFAEVSLTVPADTLKEMGVALPKGRYELKGNDYGWFRLVPVAAEDVAVGTAVVTVR